MNDQDFFNFKAPEQGPFLIAGPCSAETEDQVLAVAKALKNTKKIGLFRAGVWKPRTRPHHFSGRGTIALKWLQKVRKKVGIRTAVEVANSKHVEDALKHDIDVLWIGARTTVNPFSVQEIVDSLKGVSIPVMIKNPITADLSLWMGAIERAENAGITNIVAIHRGFSTGETSKYRNRPLWRIPMELKRLRPELPIICDPSHIAGKRDLILHICQKAIYLDMDGLMLEVHNHPEKALSDSQQQLTPTQWNVIVSNLHAKRRIPATENFEKEIALLREQIDQIDEELFKLLKGRMNIVEKIGQLKKKNNITAFQVDRMQQNLSDYLEMAEELELRQNYIREIYGIIHNESVKRQTELFN